MPPLGIPGLVEAEQSEAFDRLAAFTDCPERIAGVEVIPLTPRLALELDAGGSAFFRGGIPTSGDVAAFLWHVSVQRQKPGPWYLTRKRWSAVNQSRFITSIVTLDYFEAFGRIRDYLEDSASDGPARRESTGPAYAGWASGMVDAVASRYGWAEDEILDIPFKRLWQYWRRWSHRETEGKQIFLNKSDEVRAKWLDELNAQNREEKSA